MLFSADFDSRRMNPMVYIKFWRQACIPALLFGAELWTVTKSGLTKLERCQRWFLKKRFYLPDFVDSLLLNVISGLPTIGSLLDKKKLYFLGRILTLPKVPKVVLDILKLRLNMLNLDSGSKSTGFLGEDIAFTGNIQFISIYGRVYRFSTHTENGNRLLTAESLNMKEHVLSYCIKGKACC